MVDRHTGPEDVLVCLGRVLDESRGQAVETWDLGTVQRALAWARTAEKVCLVTRKQYNRDTLLSDRAPSALIRFMVYEYL
jgi:hypothetical protein